jgi:hypothetical protein
MLELNGDLAKILSGGQVPIDKCNIVITQPKLKEICAFGEDNFLMGIHFFTKADQVVKQVKEGNSRLGMLSDFQLLMVIIDEDKKSKNSVLEFLGLIFPDYKIRFDPGSICFLKDDSNRIIGQINPMNFIFFQSKLKTLFLPQSAELEDEYNPANDKAAEIAEKLKRGNQIRQELEQNKSKNENSSLFGEYISILSVGLGIDINIFFNYTPFQLYDSFLRYQKKVSYDFYQKIVTTPFMDGSKIEEPDNWMGSIYR